MNREIDEGHARRMKELQHQRTAPGYRSLVYDQMVDAVHVGGD